MPSYHHLDSRYARLTPKAIDLVLECVRDANEVLFDSADLSAKDMLVIARSVLETERLFERDPQLFAEPESPTGNDWTSACMAERFAVAVEHLRERGALQAAERAQAQGATVLRRLVDSATRSPLIDYTSVLRALIEAAPATKPRERLELLRRYLAHDLREHRGRNALQALLEIGIIHLTLGQHALAFDVFTQLLRQDPSALSTHAQLASALQHDFPELASAAAQRALLLATRDTSEEQRAPLRSLLERTRDLCPAAAPSEAYTALLRLLRDKPGKRGRMAVQVLCESLVPEIAYVQSKPTELLPDAQALAQLRRDLQDLPLPVHQTPRGQSKLPVTA
jgi:tetratricopeptide (TPR) repeat protein